MSEEREECEEWEEREGWEEWEVLEERVEWEEHIGTHRKNKQQQAYWPLRGCL